MFSSKVNTLHLRHSFWCSASFGKATLSRLVLGIETSCDETGAAVLDETGEILGESLHSQKHVHLRSGGIIPTIAQQLHRDNIERVVQEALERSKVDPRELSAVATTVKPGLALSLGVGLDFSKRFVRQYSKPFIPIHHMEAHALTVRMLQHVPFPFLVLLVSGGHSLLAVARGVDDFLLLGHSLDEAPGDTLDKIARRLSLITHPRCSTLSGGQAIELLAKDGDRKKFHFTTPMGQTNDCCFSFAGLRSQVTNMIQKQEREEGVEKGTLLSCVSDIAAAAQHTVASHLAKRTLRAILFCKEKGLLPPSRPSLVMSGGVASNLYIRKALMAVAETTGLQLICPPASFCTDNGVMIAWCAFCILTFLTRNYLKLFDLFEEQPTCFSLRRNGVERLREQRGILPPNVDVSYEPKAPLGIDMTAEVKATAIRLPSLKMIG